MHKIIAHNNEDILVEEPSANYSYTYADYLQWKIEERIELFKGRILKISAPNRFHQQVSGALYVNIHQFLKGKKCKIYAAPFDVRLPIQNKKKDYEVTTVVQPDICVICDETKLDDRGCCGAPDLVIEILSPGNSRKEVRLKYDIYEEAGVLEYWLVNPVEQNLVAYSLDNSGKFSGGKMYASGDLIYATSIEGLTIPISELFENT
ncbi:MAG: Uma2 family endonuclease [Chitinophagaceae bacterium]